MSKFFALLNRMKYINRWSLMRNTRQENIAEHSQHVAMIANVLAIIDNNILGKKVDADRVGMIAVYHETSEVLTGDLPTPIKYFNPEIVKAYKKIEKTSEDKLLAMLPEEIRNEIRQLVQPDAGSYEYLLVKYADKLAAYIKCIEEMESGNRDFAEAKGTIESELLGLGSACVDYFMQHFLPAYFSTLDDINAKQA